MRLPPESKNGKVGSPTIPLACPEAYVNLSTAPVEAHWHKASIHDILVAADTFRSVLALTNDPQDDTTPKVFAEEGSFRITEPSVQQVSEEMPRK